MQPRRRLCLLTLCTLLTGLCGPAGVAAQVAGTTPVELSGPALLAALRAGGYILYFRHAATDFGQNDDQMTGYEACDTQRNLTDAGRADARAIGATLRELRIPIGTVLASPYCRTMETAQLMFGRAAATPAVRGGTAQPDSPARYSALRDLLATKVPPGSNLVIASHGNPYRAVVGGDYLAEGEAAVIEPLGEAGFRVIARVRKDEWKGLVAR
jgi:broad specificity phosphatase PhoE